MKPAMPDIMKALSYFSCFFFFAQRIVPMIPAQETSSRLTQITVLKLSPVVGFDGLAGSTGVAFFSHFAL